jgi:PhnB protein
MLTNGETPFVGPANESEKDKIMNAQLPITETIHLMASDSIPGYGPLLSVGNNFHITLLANDKTEADMVFTDFSLGGRVLMPLANAPWGSYFGMCQDKFGIQWMASLDHPV